MAWLVSWLIWPFRQSWRFVVWLFEEDGLRSAIRSALVGASVAGLLIVIPAAYAAAVNLDVTNYLNEYGYVTPLPALVRLLGREDGEIKVEFKPVALEKVAICEYSRITGRSARELFLTYVDRYSMCLDLVRLKETSFVVRPNLRSGQLTQKGENFLCKCADLN